MNINSLVNQMNTVLQGSSEANISENAIRSLLLEGIDVLSKEAAGGFITGKIVACEGNTISLLLGSNAMINAKLEGDILPSINQTMSFVVNGKSDGKITLSPLFQNVNQTNTVNCALKAAGFPENPQNQYMVKQMMEEGLGINKTALLDMHKAMVQNPDTNVRSLCQMTRLNIPTEPAMVEQFQNYCSFEHEIKDALLDVVNSLVEGLASENKELTPGEAANFKNNLDILLDIPSTQANSSDKGIQVINENANEIASLKIDPQKSVEIKKYLEQLNLPESIQNMAKEGKLTQEDLIKIVKTMLQELSTGASRYDNPEAHKALKQLLGSDVFKTAIKDEVNKQFFLKPEEIAEDGKVSRLYERLTSKLIALSEAVNEQGKANTPFATAVNNLSSNVDFMNQLNQTFNYVQIPLKLSNQEATGELYVYSRKKALSKEDDSVSALLHLDMDHLGPVDVHVSMNNSSNVKTHFMLKDEEALELIADNIGILDERLRSRGYNMSCEFTKKEDSRSVVQMIAEECKNVSIISSASFDARA